MNKEEITELYSNQAGSLRAKGRYKDAERLAHCGIATAINYFCCFFVFLAHDVVFTSVSLFLYSCNSCYN